MYYIKNNNIYYSETENLHLCENMTYKLKNIHTNKYELCKNLDKLNLLDNTDSSNNKYTCANKICTQSDTGTYNSFADCISNCSGGPSPAPPASSPASQLNDRYNRKDIIALRIFDGNLVKENDDSHVSLSLFQKGNINGLFNMGVPSKDNRSIGIIYNKNVKVECSFIMDGVTSGRWLTGTGTGCTCLKDQSSITKTENCACNDTTKSMPDLLTLFNKSPPPTIGMVNQCWFEKIENMMSVRKNFLSQHKPDNQSVYNEGIYTGQQNDTHFALFYATNKNNKSIDQVTLSQLIAYSNKYDPPMPIVYLQNIDDINDYKNDEVIFVDYDKSGAGI